MAPAKGLTAAKVRQIREPGKYYDGNGLFLRVEKTGSRRWVQRVTINGKRREIGLGSADLVPLAEARNTAIEYRRIARSGGDPMAVRQSAAAAPSFNDAVDRVIELYAPSWSNAKHATQFRNTLITYAAPTIGRKPVSDVTSADVLRILTPIWASKAETARRVKQRIGTVMKWAVAQGYRTDDPSAAISQALPKSPHKVKHRKSLPYNEVATCIDVIRASQAMIATKLALEFLILTAARSGEVRGATWEEMDIANKTWTIPANRMKAKTEHVVPLSDRAAAILTEAKKLSKDGLVFPGQRHGRPLSDMTLSKLLKELGLQADVHGFRTSFRVWVQEQTNTSFEVAEKALAHTTQNKVVAAYARSDLFDKRRNLMEAWARYLNPEQANVISIKAGK
ncbi:tyrosine-type recombinase/integrase [Roseovarius sp. 10]|uniref:tyrosine-type recombinase/integrase n=1 Tax=Roseovarius sp. 10 TaxID=3080563 RepID=UPI002954B141|nr:integrase arm-type DNA-binding domain-containing protein [Roseovarius sp. 10]MDV7201479.1 tyrosine-type recombinase/integrase [Roseovarius sp. 10]